MILHLDVSHLLFITINYFLPSILVISCSLFCCIEITSTLDLIKSRNGIQFSKTAIGRSGTLDLTENSLGKIYIYFST